MKRRIIFAAAIALMSSSALAADMFAPQQAYDWSGFYLGLHGGYAWTDIDRETNDASPVFANSYDADGLFVGGQAGFNHQLGWFVGGIEIDGSWSDIDGDDGGAGGTTDTTEIDLMGAANLRAGVAWNQVLLFATGGVAAADFVQSNSSPGTSDESEVFWGWTVGGGVDVAVTDNFIVGIAYRYVDYGDEDFNLGSTIRPFNIDSTQQQVRVTASYKF